ncbi:MAG: hypothetical protein AABY32_04240 [Nanoarchaeota archaeon]
MEKKIQHVEYLGSSLTAIDDEDGEKIWKPEEMVNMIETSKKYNINLMLPFIKYKLKNKIISNPNSFNCGISHLLHAKAMELVPKQFSCLKQ